MLRSSELSQTGRISAFLGAVFLGALFALVFLPAMKDTPEPGFVEAGPDRGNAPGRLVGEPNQSGRDLIEPNGEFPEALARDGAEPADSLTRESGEPNTSDVPPANDAVASTLAPEPSTNATTSAPSPTAAPVTQSPSTAAPAAPSANSSAPTTAAPPTTAAAPRPTPSTTAAPANNAGGASQPVDAATFTDWPIRNTNLDNRTQFVNTPASQLNWQQFTEGSDRTVQLGSTTPNKHLGQFRTQCSFSHFAYDDPLVFPGQEGAAHLHMFFGNTQANADSTYRSLRDSGSSSCNGFEGNRSAYWVPAIFDATGDVRIPSRIEVYYKSHDRSFSNVQKPPEGLGMVAGQAANNPNIEWGCQETGAQGVNLNRPVQQRQNTIPRCSGTATLLAHIMFPQCLSGNVGQGGPRDNSSQLQYPTRGYFTNSCPAGSTYMTAIEYFLAWNPDNHDGRTDEWFIASDVRPDGSRAPNGSTLHGDWFGAWNPGLMDRIHETCISQLAECGWDLTGNNQRLQWVEHFGGKNGAAYSGRREIPAAEISEALCAGDPYGRTEDAALCG